ncbi:hypothetical protein [Flavobacterium sp.]|uniref:hypothetical protein n=1 Tax=Flavobacterium sp. TaxID=239 RepID=UPI002618D20B|nr:hypothetical protein [Flavobacterium sp.]
MRPFIDLNNLWYSDETLVYYSRYEIVSACIFQIVIVLLFYFSLINNNYIVPTILLLPTYFLVKKIKQLYIERNVIQLTINSYGIKVKDEQITSWENIENERIIRIGKRKNSRHDFVFYDKSQHKKIQIRTDILNFGCFELLDSAKIHRERYNRRNEII